MRTSALLCIALLFSYRADATFQSPLFDFDYTATLNGPGLQSYSSGSVRSGFDNPFDVPVGDHRLGIALERINGEEYAARIHVYRGDGGDWQEISTEPLNYSARFGSEVGHTFSIGELTLRLDSVTSVTYFRLVDGGEQATRGDAYLLFAAIALLLASAIVVLYLRRT